MGWKRRRRLCIGTDIAVYVHDTVYAGTGTESLVPSKNHPSGLAKQHAVRLRPFCNWGIDFLHTVTGTLSPDATGSFTTVGTYNGDGYSRRADSGYYIWWNGTDKWIMSVVLGTVGTAYWERTDPNIIGVYSPAGTATGDATIAKTV